MAGSSGTNATATITFTVFGEPEPTSCTSGGTTLGTATPAGDGTYTSSGTFTPTLAGDYLRGIAFGGRCQQQRAASACTMGMSETVVAAAISATVVTSSANPLRAQPHADGHGDRLRQPRGPPAPLPSPTAPTPP